MDLRRCLVDLTFRSGITLPEGAVVTLIESLGALGLNTSQHISNSRLRAKSYAGKLPNFTSNLKS